MELVWVLGCEITNLMAENYGLNVDNESHTGMVM
jgi:hypothetical protein